MLDDSNTPYHVDHRHHVHMTRALELAQESFEEGSFPVGSVIVMDKRIVGEGRNIQAVSGDVLEHAEIRALRDAVNRTGRRNLAGAACYSTVESCPMCVWALQSLGVGTIVLGATFSGMGRTDLGDYSIERLSLLTGRAIQVVHGVLVHQCMSLRMAMKVS